MEGTRRPKGLTVMMATGIVVAVVRWMLVVTMNVALVVTT
jgi:hypothetical protein